MSFPKPDSLSAPAQLVVAVTTSDVANLPNGTCRALYIGVSGDVTLDDASGNTSVTFKSVAVGILPVSCARVRVTGTTATNIVALY